MTEWERVDRYLERLLVPPLAGFDSAGLPPHEVTPLQGRLLELLARLAGAGAVADPDAGDPSVTGVQRFLELVAQDPRLDATAIQTVGAKGWDGFALALVR